MVDIAAAVREARGVRRVRFGELPRIAGVLGSAFLEDPAVSWLVPDERRRGAMMERAFLLFLERVWFAQGECYTTEGAVGAAVWELPGRWQLGAVQQVRLLPALVSVYRGLTPRVMRALAAMESNHPRDEHYYLPFVGVTPQWQGRGIGAALLTPILERCDRDGIPAYLEATTPRNRALYERHGFAVTEEFRLGNASPPLWRMWRKPGG